MKTIIIVSWNCSSNYGTVLQAYALDTYIRSQGYHCFEFLGTGKVLSLRNLDDIYHSLMHPIKVKVFSLIKNKKESREKDYLKEKRVKDFCNMFFNYIVINNKVDFLKKVPKDTIFLVGSDQVWNPYYLHETKLLYFVPKQYKKISYASSVGVEYIPQNKRKIYKKYLKRFNNISVREKAGKKVLEELGIKGIDVVADPTFLLHKEDWLKLADLADEGVKRNENYIFSYFVGSNAKNRELTLCLKKKLSISVLNVISGDGTEVCDMYEKGVGPCEFIWLLSHSKMIITDSFHAVAIALNLNKEFMVVNRFEKNNIHSQNSRIADILDEVQLQEKLVENESDVLKQAEVEINYIKVNEILAEQKKKAVHYLLNCLGKNDEKTY